MQKEIKNMSTNEIVDIIDNHDCHLSPDDGCQCIFLKEELLRRRGIEFKDSVVL